MGMVSGEFDVAMVPQPVAELNGDSGIGRMTLDKRY